MPVCDPPFGNDTHLPHSGRIHSCPNTLELTTIAATTIKPRIISSCLVLSDTQEITWLRALQALRAIGTACSRAKYLATVRARILALPPLQEPGDVHDFARYCCPRSARNHRI